MRIPASAFLVAALLLVPASARAAAPSDDARAGLDLLSERGCLACHSTDGTARVGPTLLGLYGGEVDDDFLRRAIREPNADLRHGYPANTMPVIELGTRELDQVVAAIRHLGEADVVTERRRDEGTLWMLIAGAIVFVFGHLAMSWHPVRTRLVARLGSGGFQGAYSLVALVGFGLLVWGWIEAPYVAVWTPPLWTRLVPMSVMPVAFFLIIGSSLGKSPTAAGQEGVLASDPAPRGVQTITRHPMLWGFALWGFAHAPPNGDVATLILIASVVVLSIAGMVHIDRRRARTQGADWDRYAARTSLIPFAAALRGRTRLHGRGMIVPLLAALAAHTAVIYLHEWVIGVSALPYAS